MKGRGEHEVHPGLYRLLFQLVLEFGAEFSDFGGDDARAIALVGMEVVIVEMVVFGAVEVGVRGDLCDDGGIPNMLRSDFLDLVLRLLFLLGVAGEDDRAVLRAFIRALAVERGGVADGEQDLQQVAVGDDLGVEDDVDGFGVAGVTFLDLLVTGVFPLSTRIARFDAFHAFELFEDGFHAPKTSGSEGRGLLAGFGDFRRRGFRRVGVGDMWRAAVRRQGSQYQGSENARGHEQLKCFHDELKVGIGAKVPGLLICFQIL